MSSLSLTAQDLKPGARLIAATKARFLELLRLRYSSPLFRLPSAAHVQKQLRHHNTGPAQARVSFGGPAPWSSTAPHLLCV